MWLRRKAIEGLFSVKAFELELLQPGDEKAFVTFEWTEELGRLQSVGSQRVEHG